MELLLPFSGWWVSEWDSFHVTKPAADQCVLQSLRTHALHSAVTFVHAVVFFWIIGLET